MKWHKLDIDPRIISESSVVKPIIPIENNLKEMTTENGVRYLLPRIEAIHAGATRNETIYLADKLRGHEELKSGVFSWTKPYPKPVIYNHDVETEVTGRVHTASFTEYTTAGRAGIIVVPKISYPKAVQDILDGRLLTVSIGATTDGATCTICGTDIINEGFCGHYKGEIYDGKKAQWECGNLWFDELSWVNVPADQDAMVVDLGAVVDAVPTSRESVIVTTESTQKNPEERDEEKMEELQKQVEALQAKLAEAETEKETLVAEKEVLSKEKEALVAEKEELETKITNVTEELESEKTKLAEKESELEEKAKEVESFKEALATEKEAREQLAVANTELAGEVHESKVTHLVDLRFALGKESSKEEALTKFKARSIESINDSISDLAEETIETTPQKRVVEKVEHPAETTQFKQETKESLTSEDILKKLLLGQK